MVCWRLLQTDHRTAQCAWLLSPTNTIRLIKTTLKPSKYPWGPDFGQFRSTTRCFRDKGFKKLGSAPNDHRLTLHIWNLKSVLCTLKYLSLRAKLCCFTWWPAVFKMQCKVVENQKFDEGPQSDLEPLTVKSTLYTLSTCPRGPNFGPFHCMTSCLRGSKLLKLGSAPDLRMTLEH